MAEVKVYVGSSTHYGAHVDDRMVPVAFEGEEVASVQLDRDARGNRGVTETLYKVPEGYVVLVERWTKWQGESCVNRLVKVSVNDLVEPGGRFYDLGLAAGMARPLTLAEALQEGGQGDG